MLKIIKKLVLSTQMAPQAIGPYSQAILVDKTIYVSGQLGLRADTMKLVEGGGCQGSQASSLQHWAYPPVGELYL